MGDPLRGRTGHLLLGLLPFVVAGAVIARQARPFAIVSDDQSYYRIATTAAAAAREGMEKGMGAAVGGFFRASSVTGDLPPHISRKRPLLLWVWSAAYLAGGDQALTVLWRFLYLALIGALFLVLRQHCPVVIAGPASAVVASAPAMQGLLTWMSCSTYLVGYSTLLAGMWVLGARRGIAATLAGVAALVAAMLSREVIVLLVPTAVAAGLWVAGRRRLAYTLPALAAATWLALPAEDRSVLEVLGVDADLVVRASLAVIAGHLASLIRNLGVLLIGSVAIAASPRPRLTAVLVIAALFFPWLAMTIPPLALIETLRTRRPLAGVIWASVTILSLCLYGTFTSRYAMEPLLGLALAVAPALAQRGMSRARWLLGPLVVGHLVLCLAPDLVYRWPPVRTVVTVADQRFGSLAALTRWREGEWESFAGRAAGPWEPIPNRSLVSGNGVPEGRVARSGDYLRLGYGISLHCPPAGDTVIRRDGMWEWNVWYWRVVPLGKTSGIHVLDPTPWSVHPGDHGRDHARCRRVIPSPPVERGVSAPEAINEWLADIPELMNRGRARAWLAEVWDSEEGCPVPMRPSSFREQELGRLFLRDDGWLDQGELAYLRRHARRSRER